MRRADPNSDRYSRAIHMRQRVVFFPVKPPFLKGSGYSETLTYYGEPS